MKTIEWKFSLFSSFESIQLDLVLQLLTMMTKDRCLIGFASAIWCMVIIITSFIRVPGELCWCWSTSYFLINSTVNFIILLWWSVSTFAVNDHDFNHISWLMMIIIASFGSYVDESCGDDGQRNGDERLPLVMRMIIKVKIQIFWI